MRWLVTLLWVWVACVCLDCVFNRVVIVYGFFGYYFICLFCYLVLGFGFDLLFAVLVVCTLVVACVII